MSPKKKTANELLVAILPKKSALDRLLNEHWYHIPVESAPGRWPPRLLAFYQGKVFGPEAAYHVRYFGEVERIDVVPRKELFPDDEQNLYKAERLYYRLQVSRPEERQPAIVSLRPRRLVFIPTTWEKFSLAEQINDLFDGSKLEDRLYDALKHNDILPERQWKLKIRERAFYLDFAVFCKNGKLAIETDGYKTHYGSPTKIDYDTWRQNLIDMDEWRYLHYTSKHVSENKVEYLAQIQTTVEQLGGLERPQEFNRKIGEEQAEYLVDDDEDYD